MEARRPAPVRSITPNESWRVSKAPRYRSGQAPPADPPHVWHQEVAAPGHADGYDGAVNDYFLVRTTRFDPRGALSDDELAAEHITGMRWWRHKDIAEYSGTDLFSPRDIATPLAALIAGDIPHTPVMLGL
jgi:8-oxo-dGTP diphosphatase